MPSSKLFWCISFPSPTPFKLFGVVTFLTAFTVSDHRTSFKVRYKIETVLVQVINSSIAFHDGSRRSARGMMMSIAGVATPPLCRSGGNGLLLMHL